MVELDDFILSKDIDIIRWTVWSLFYFAAFTGTWIPIWRQSERLEPYLDANGKKRQRVVIYGWQTRKRREKELGLWWRWILMNPDYVYNSVLWFVLHICATSGSYYAHTEPDEGDLRSLALWMAALQGSWFGMWTISPFYWDMPGWGVLHLLGSFLISLAVNIMYGFLDWTACWFFLPYTTAQLVMTVVYGIAFIGAISTRTPNGHRMTIGNPLSAFCSENGLHPVSFLEKDLYLPKRVPQKTQQGLATLI